MPLQPWAKELIQRTQEVIDSGEGNITIYIWSRPVRDGKEWNYKIQGGKTTRGKGGIIHINTYPKRHWDD